MSLNQRTVLVTGSKGFIGKNLVVKLKENSSNVLEYTRSESLEELKKFINESEVIFHLALGVLRLSHLGCCWCLLVSILHQDFHF